ncbi:iron donor protein CyaY [Rhodoferax aquaticus]|uniref:Iron-sulfur cluster assembly protein CyaY n=1 Tax=Rhodoferax aquaticus TaxID=2527691 RepID=A0A515ESZ5_9BURK|nr:iron donor protein CyaY [Rhodoferax aquaticus]QDL55796.1 iron donor protein CyaY [Rhodoferax aquaticus]
MTDAEFMDRAEALLNGIETNCDRLNEEMDVDLDNQRIGNMLTITFSNRSQVILNLQKPLQEVWLAARSGGYHFRWVATGWEDSKGLGSLPSILARCASEQAGRDLQFTSLSS